MLLSRLWKGCINIVCRADCISVHSSVLSAWGSTGRQVLGGHSISFMGCGWEIMSGFIADNKQTAKKDRPVGGLSRLAGHCHAQKDVKSRFTVFFHLCV